MGVAGCGGKDVQEGGRTQETCVQEQSAVCEANARHQSICMDQDDA